MIAVLLAGAIVAAPISIRPREVALLHVTSPRGWSSATPTSAFLAAFESVLEAKTKLDVRSAEQLGIDPSALESCPVDTRLSCWLDRLSAPDGPRYFFMLAVQPGEGERDRLRLVLMDVAAARAAKRAVEDPEGDQTAEDRVFATLHATDGALVATASGDDLARYYERALEHLATPLGPAWGGLAKVVVRAARPSMSFDGRDVGAASETVELDDVPPGRHEIRADEVRMEVFVEANATATVVLPGPTPETHVARTATRWGGAGLAVIGVVLTGVGVARRAAVREGCIVSAGGDASCGAVGGPAIGFDASSLPTTDADALGGPSFLGLGAGLFVTGAAAAAGATWIGAEEDPPWVALVAALAAGAATFAIVTVVEGR